MQLPLEAILPHIYQKDVTKGTEHDFDSDY